jgi:hypothetical protein
MSAMPSPGVSRTKLHAHHPSRCLSCGKPSWYVLPSRRVSGACCSVVSRSVNSLIRWDCRCSVTVAAAWAASTISWQVRQHVAVGELPQPQPRHRPEPVHFDTRGRRLSPHTLKRRMLRRHSLHQ